MGVAVLVAPVSCNPGGMLLTGLTYGLRGVTAGEGVGLLGVAGVSVGPSAGVSVGVGGRGSGEPPMSLAPLSGGDTVATGEVEAAGAGLRLGVGVGEVPGGQRLQAAAQYPPTGALGLCI